MSEQGPRGAALEGKLPGAAERENRGWCYQVLNSRFCCELSHHFLSLEIKPLLFVPLRHRIQFGVSSVKRCLEKVGNPQGMRPTMGNVGKIDVCPILEVYDLTVRSKNRRPENAFNYISFLNVSLPG